MQFIFQKKSPTKTRGDYTWPIYDFTIIADKINVFFAFIHYELLTYKDFSLAYSVYGRGNHVFLAFHGFSKSGDDFRIFEKDMANEWRIFAFHWFFHHPQSSYPKHRITRNEISKQELSEMVLKFLDEQKLESVGLMAHSMGGKYAMSIAEIIPEKIDKLVLFAADGIKRKFWNSFAVRNFAGRYLFEQSIKNPSTAIKFASFVKKLGLINEKTHAITHQALVDLESRNQVFNTWMSARNLFPDLKKLNHVIKKNKIELFGLYGTKDKIIRIKEANDWAKTFKPKQIIYPINSGHIILKEKNLNEILEVLR